MFFFFLNQHLYNYELSQIVKVIECLEKSSGKVALPTNESNFDEKLFKGKMRSDLKPLHVIQPEGPSY